MYNMENTQHLIYNSTHLARGELDHRLSSKSFFRHFGHLMELGFLATLAFGLLSLCLKEFLK